MNNRKYSLLYLLPYLARYRSRLWAGFLMVGLTTGASMVSPWILKYVIDDLHNAFAREKLINYAALLIGMSLVEGFFRFWMRKILISISREVEYDLRNDFLSSVQKQSLSFFQARNTGDIMSRATNDLNAVRSVLGPGIMYSATTFITVILATVILLHINWKLTLLAYVPLALASVTVKKFGQQIHDRFELIQEQFSTITTKAQENLSGIRVVKAFAREQSEVEEFRRLNHEYVCRSVSLIRLWGLFYPLMTALLGMSTVVLLWLGGRQVIAGRLSLGEFVAFMGYLGMLVWPTIAAGWVINIFQRGAASMKRMLEILEYPPDIEDEPDASVPAPMEGAIEMRGLTFRYPNTSDPVLKDISISLPAGEILAIVGHTGCGKSTLINLIPRLFDPPQGSIFIDGRDIRKWPLSDLRKIIGYVPQETFLFSDTISANISFGKDDATRKEIERTACISHIDDDIRSFPKQFETFVGERGITLSGGQKQRVAISRALAVQPKILILDDSLSNVDTDTEEKILNGLSDIMKGRTTILVSHRISTVRNAHQIVVLKQGRVAERGNHESLMALRGIYWDLYQKQLLEEELASA